MFSCSSSQSYSLVHCSVLSVSVTASVQYLIPSSSYSLSLFICSPPPPLFHNPDEKTGGECSEDIPRGQTSVGRGNAESWRGKASEGGGRGREREMQKEEKKYDMMVPCNANRQDPRPVEKRLESYSKQRGHGEGSTLKFIICSLPELNASMYTRGIRACTEKMLADTQLQSRGVLIKPRCLLQRLTLWHRTWQRHTERAKASEWKWGRLVR